MAICESILQSLTFPGTPDISVYHYNTDRSLLASALNFHAEQLLSPFAEHIDIEAERWKQAMKRLLKRLITQSECNRFQNRVLFLFWNNLVLPFVVFGY